MRIWDLKPSILCRQHLLGEHRELHAIWSIIVNDKPGYASHPETRRWRGKLKALYNRHERLVDEMLKRGYSHRSNLDPELATGDPIQTTRLDSVARQAEILDEKGCACKTSEV